MKTKILMQSQHGQKPIFESRSVYNFSNKKILTQGKLMGPHIDNTYTTYYLTVLESKMWMDFEESYTALGYQNPEQTSLLKFNTILLLTGAINPLKHCTGAVERTIRCFSSIVLGVFSLTGQILHLNALCPTRFVETCHKMKRTIGSPLENLKFACHHLFLGIIFGIATPHFIYENWNNARSNNWANDCLNELERMNGTYVSTSDMYRAANNPPLEITT